MISLREELLGDPLGIGYSGMTDAAVLVSLNDETARSLPDLEEISSGDLYETIDSTEYTSLLEGEKDQVRVLLGLGGVINIGPSSKARNNLINLFGVGTTTRNELIALVTGRTQSRSQELNFPVNLNEGDIAAARLPAQP